MKFGRDQPLTTAVLRRDGFRCAACGFSLRCALAAHHRVPRAHGGVDAESNLTTLCANCHKIVHWLSVGKRLGSQEAEQAEQVLKPEVYQRVCSLAEAIRTSASEMKQSGNSWLASDETNAPTPLEDALARVAHRNKLSLPTEDAMVDATKLVLSHIPSDIRSDCAFRLTRGDQFFSINLGGLLLYRTPGYPDGGKRPDNEMLLIWPEDIAISVIPDWEAYKEDVGFAKGGRFGAIRCVNVELAFHEAMALNSYDWSAFVQACRAAGGLSRTRPWVSNVSVGDVQPVTRSPISN